MFYRLCLLCFEPVEYLYPLSHFCCFLPSQHIPEFVISYLGILKIGAIAVSVNVMLKTAEVSYILNDCAAKAIITTELQSKEVKETDLPELQHILIAEGKTQQGD